MEISKDTKYILENKSDDINLSTHQKQIGMPGTRPTLRAGQRAILKGSEIDVNMKKLIDTNSWLVLSVYDFNISSHKESVSEEISIITTEDTSSNLEEVSKRGRKGKNNA